MQVEGPTLNKQLDFSNYSKTVKNNSACSYLIFLRDSIHKRDSKTSLMSDKNDKNLYNHTDFKCYGIEVCDVKEKDRKTYSEKPALIDLKHQSSEYILEQTLEPIHEEIGISNDNTMAEEEIIEIDADSLEIALLQTSCNQMDNSKTLQSISPLSEKTLNIGRKQSVPVDTLDSSKSGSDHTTIRPSLVRQAKSRHCESPETSSPDLSSNPSSGSIPKRQRTYSPSSSSDSSRSSPSTAITWSALGCNVAPSGKVSSHVSAVAAAAKAATSGGRRQNQRPPQATNRRLGLPIQRALTLPSSTEESQALLDVNYGESSNQTLGTGKMKDICLMMKSPMRVTPPSFPNTTEHQEKEDFITIEIEKDVVSDKTTKLSSDNTLQCDSIAKIDSISNSSTSETLIDIQINPSLSSELNKNEKDLIDDEIIDSTVIKEEQNTENVNICMTSTDASPQEELVVKGANPSTKREDNESSSENNACQHTIASSSEIVKIDMPDTVPAEESRASDSFDGILKTSSSGNKLMRAQTLACSRDASPSRHRGQASLSYIIPTFTVTINPLEANEVTLPLPDSPKNAEATTSRSSIGDRVDNHSSIGRTHSSRSKKSYGHRSIANTTIIVDDDGNEVVKEDIDEKERMLSVDSAGNGEDDEFRRCSIGSASSLQEREDNGNNVNSGEAGSDHMDRLGLGDLGIRRVSDISHINEIRREVDGMEHLASEFYEISREPNPDAISLDSIHKRVLKRCQNKYIPAQRSSTANKCFVVITTGFTVLGIIYGFWYKNFGPGKLDDH